MPTWTARVDVTGQVEDAWRYLELFPDVDYYYLRPKGYANLGINAWLYRGGVTTNGYWPPKAGERAPPRVRSANSAEGFKSLNFVSQNDGNLPVRDRHHWQGFDGSGGGADEMYL